MANTPKPQRAVKKLNRVIEKPDVASAYGTKISKKDVKKAGVAGKKVQAVWDKNKPYKDKKAAETEDTKRDPNKGRVVGKPTGTRPVKNPQKWVSMQNNIKSSPVAKKKNGQ
jgi:hypothetical protein